MLDYVRTYESVVLARTPSLRPGLGYFVSSQLPSFWVEIDYFNRGNTYPLGPGIHTSREYFHQNEGCGEQRRNSDRRCP